MKIGVFDSGIGGQRIAKLLQLEFPKANILSVSDKENLPYGNKTIAELKKLVLPKIINMEASGCELIVIACNTVTTNLILDIRKTIRVPVVGFEPMIKPASKLTKTKTITICATPATLNSKRYNLLKKRYANDFSVIEPDCSNWAALIENNKLNTNHIKKIIAQTKDSGSDVIVLACTHYHWIEQLLYDNLNGKVTILQPEEAVVKRVRTLTRYLN